jgi:hypothetical protein
MRQSLVVLIVLFITVNISFSAEKYEGLRYSASMKYFQEQEIKSFVLTKYKYEFGVPARLGNIVKDYVFDSDYRIIQSKLYDDDEYNGKISYEYNQDGDTVKIIWYNRKDIETKKQEFKYQSPGKIIERDYFDEGIFYAKDIYIYNTNGMLAEYQNFSKKNLEYTIKYQYNDKNKQTVWERFDDEGTLELKGVSEYNEKGRKTDSTYYYKGKVDSKAKYKYDNVGNVTDFILNSENGELIYRYEYQYNKINQLITEKKYDNQDVMVEYYDIQYNKDGQLNQIHKYGEKEFLIDIWKFEYFLNGLIKSEQYLNNIEIPQFIRRYTFEPQQN